MPRVLVVDDSLSVRKMVERALEMKGFEVLAAASGTEAMERLDSAMPDLVVCDVVMPDVDGYRICEFVRAHPTLSETIGEAAESFYGINTNQMPAKK